MPIFETPPRKRFAQPPREQGCHDLNGRTAHGAGGFGGNLSPDHICACKTARKIDFPFRRRRFMVAVMESQARQVMLVPVPDRRQSETALAVARGTARLLRSLGFACISELPLPSGRRADIVAINERGEIWIVEIKSSQEDLRADQKWPEYRAHCDRLFFAFTSELSCEIFPTDTGLIVADAYGAHMHCPAPEHRLPAPTRKLMTVRFAMAAAQRFNRLLDPQGHAEF
jgi:hypothetical protein